MLELVILSVAVQAGQITPVGGPQTLAWKGKEVGYLAPSGKPLSFTVEGPTVIALELRIAGRGKDLEVQITRDDAFVSENKLRLQRKPRGPQGFPMVGKLHFSVPDGKHSYTIKSSRNLGQLQPLSSTCGSPRKDTAKGPGL